MAAINEVIDLSIEDGIAVVTSNHAPVNALSAIVRDGLTAAFDKAIGDTSVKAIVLTCAGRTFFAGADISEFGKPPKGASLHALFDVIEASPKPVVAAIHGTSLGGGFETALVCHYRVAVPSAKVGLPEVKLGLLAGAGGTQRLPRIVGAAKALEMVTSGLPVGGKAALAAGLVDELAPEAELRATAIAFARKVLAEKRPLKKVRDLTVAGATPELFAEFRAKNAKAFRGFEAPEASIKCIEAAARLPFDEGKKFEREEFVKLVSGVQSQAQRYMFFAERQAAKIDGLPEGTATRPVKRVGIIGAGTMGGGIAMNFLNKGIPVTIVETQAAALDRGQTTIRKNYENTAAKGRMTQDDVETRMAALSPSLDLASLADCDLIIEAVFENMAVKKEIFAKLDKICKPGAILASNTSYLDVDEIASATSASAGRGRHAFLQPRQRDEAAGGGARREDRARRAGHRHGHRQDHRQGGGGLGRVPRLHRQPHAGAAPGAGDGVDPGRRDALGRGPRGLRLRLADGPVPDVRPGGAGYRLVEGDEQGRDDP